MCGVGGSGKAHLWIIYLGQMNHLALESCKKGLSFYSPKPGMKTTNSGSCYYSMLEKPVDQKKKHNVKVENYVLSADGEHRNQIDYILCSQRWRSSIQSAKTRPGGDCGSDHELLIAKFRLKLKKVGKTTRPFRYDLNRIPYDYIVEVRISFKGLALIDRVPDELWMEVG